MAVIRCGRCDELVDLDYDVEHEEMCGAQEPVVATVSWKAKLIKASQRPPKWSGFYKVNTLPSTQPDVAGRYTRTAERKGLRCTIGEAVRLNGGPPPKPLEHSHLIITRHSSSQPDYEGVVYSSKALIDGLRADKGRKGDSPITCAGVIVDDSPKHTTREYHWELAKPGHGFTTIEVIERDV